MGGFDLSDLLWPDVSQGRQAQNHAAVERVRRSPLFVINGTEITDATDRKIAVIGAVNGTGPSGRCISADATTKPFISSPSSVITGDRTVVLVCKSNTTSVTAVYYTSSSAGGVAYWVGQNGTAWTIGGVLSGSSNSANQTDQVVVAVKNGATHTLYIDGVQVASGTNSISDGTGSSFLSFGTNTGYDVWPSNGQLYVAALYDVALDATEIKSISRNPKIFKTPVNIPFVITSAGGGGLSLTGSLTGQGSTLSASATNTEVHALSGALVGAGATLSGTATRIYSLTGSLTGQGATLSGSATTLESHAATGALVGSGSTLSATATNTEIHTATGALVGAGSTLAATATNIEIHAATGSLIGAGSTLSGSATHTPAGINASGSLVGQGATLSATATNTEVHTCTGSLYGQGATLSGALTRVFSASGSLVGAGSTLSATAGNAVAVFSATGSLVGQGSTLAGSATNTETHAVSGSLVGQGSTLSATAALANLHTLSGSLVGSGSSLVGYASGPTTAFEASPDAIVTVINKRNRVSVISRRS